jgi:hypothetical protein
MSLLVAYVVRVLLPVAVAAALVVVLLRLIALAYFGGS